jgi:hypothetical protein
MQPPLDLTVHLGELAAAVGYTVDLDELDPTCANHPELVTAWVLTAVRHATVATRRPQPQRLSVADRLVGTRRPLA